MGHCVLQGNIYDFSNTDKITVEFELSELRSLKNINDQVKNACTRRTFKTVQLILRRCMLGLAGIRTVDTVFFTWQHRSIGSIGRGG